MAQAKKGDQVKVHYTGKLEDGRVFDSTEDKTPFEFVLGKGTVISGFEQAVQGMEQGEKKSIEVESARAYGPHQKEMVFNIERNKLPADLELEVGRQLQHVHDNGQKQIFTITNLTDAAVTLDGNHPLAGRDLKFDIELVEIA